MAKHCNANLPHHDFSTVCKKKKSTRSVCIEEMGTAVERELFVFVQHEQGRAVAGVDAEAQRVSVVDQLTPLHTIEEYKQRRASLCLMGGSCGSGAKKGASVSAP